MRQERRKFQVCNGYLLEFDQLARVLAYLKEQHSPKVSREALIEGTGLSNRQIESLVSIGAAVGLIQRGRQTLTAEGTIVAKHDISIEAMGSLEWCHYRGAGSYRNLIWFEIFNTVLPNEPAMDRDGWMTYLRGIFAGQYTERTIGKHLYEEVRFIVDAYLNRNFKRLGLLAEERDHRIGLRRYANPHPLVFAAMLYHLGAQMDASTLQVGRLPVSPGTPAIVFGMDEPILRRAIEALHGSGWIRYEHGHSLDQIRLLPGYSPSSFLYAYYEGKQPVPLAPSLSGGLPA